jgi:K+ transporter
MDLTDDIELQKRKPNNQYAVTTKLSFLFMSFKTLGVIYGDIGTSPLYSCTREFSLILLVM